MQRLRNICPPLFWPVHVHVNLLKISMWNECEVKDTSGSIRSSFLIHRNEGFCTVTHPIPISSADYVSITPFCTPRPSQRSLLLKQWIDRHHADTILVVFPVSMNANIHCINMAPDYYFVQPQFGNNDMEWSKIKMATPCNECLMAVYSIKPLTVKKRRKKKKHP